MKWSGRVLIIQTVALRYQHIATELIISHQHQLNGKPWLAGIGLQTIQNDVDLCCVFIVAEVRQLVTITFISVHVKLDTTKRLTLQQILSYVSFTHAVATTRTTITITSTQGKRLYFYPRLSVCLSVCTVNYSKRYEQISTDPKQSSNY